jgi:diacylglycerol kinase (ATP)
MLPPNALTIPRTELPMEQLLNIQACQLESGNSRSSLISIIPSNFTSVASPSRVIADDVSGSSADDPKEKEDSEILRIFDGNNSLRNQVYRTASVPKTASTQQIRVSSGLALPIFSRTPLFDDSTSRRMPISTM